MMYFCVVGNKGWWESVSESDAGVERVRFEVRRVGDAEGW
jgi:hypothetical protein